MRDLTKRKLKAAGVTALEVPIEAGAALFHKTLGRAGRSISATYWSNRQWELSKEIKACEACPGNEILTGYRWNYQQERFCENHSAEAHKIITHYNSTL